jgi:hypothetical protein
LHHYHPLVGTSHDPTFNAQERRVTATVTDVDGRQSTAVEQCIRVTSVNDCPEVGVNEDPSVETVWATIPDNYTITPAHIWPTIRVTDRYYYYYYYYY